MLAIVTNSLILLLIVMEQQLRSKDFYMIGLRTFVDLCSAGIVGTGSYSASAYKNYRGPGHAWQSV